MADQEMTKREKTVLQREREAFHEHMTAIEIAFAVLQRAIRAGTNPNTQLAKLEARIEMTEQTRRLVQEENTKLRDALSQIADRRTVLSLMARGSEARLVMADIFDLADNTLYPPSESEEEET